MKGKSKLLISLVTLFMLTMFMTGFENENNYENKKFKDNVVFYAQHQDDETLWASAAIIDAINEVGVDNVYIVQVSYGTGIKVFKNEKNAIPHLQQSFANLGDKFIKKSKISFLPF